MKTVIDPLGRTVTYPFPPKRIVCICPAITETLIELGVPIVGRTKYCLHPKGQVEHIPIVGGTKQVDVEKILALAPDLIITEKEDNSKEIVTLLAQHLPVYVAQVESVQDAYAMITAMGELCDREVAAKNMVATIQQSFATLPKKHVRAGYVIWRKPYMVAGATTYIHDVLSHLGFTNPFAHLDGRYPVVSIETLQKINVDVLFLASEPFPFSEKHLEEFRAFLPNTHIQLIDGEMFWYGAKMSHAPTYFKHFFEV